MIQQADMTEHGPMTQTDLPTTSPAKRVNRPVAAAAAYAAMTSIVHIIGGGLTVERKVAATSMAEEPRLVALGVWQMGSITLALSAVALAVGATERHAERSSFLLLFISVAWIAFGLAMVAVPLLQSRGDILWLSQPLFLMPVGVLGLWGLSQRRATATAG